MDMLKAITSFLLTVLLVSTQSIAQTYEIDNVNGTTINTCSGTFYDSGGSGGNYLNGESYSVTICATTPSQQVVFDFTSWNVEDQSSCSWDAFYIYDGTSSGSPLRGVYCSSSPGTIKSIADCFHFVFTSDGSVVESGWAATISCTDNVCLGAESYEDQFASINYSNSNGSINWTGDSWVETGDDGNASSGDIQIRSGGNLRMDHDDATLPSIARSVDLSGATEAYLKFDYRETSSLESDDVFEVDVYDGSTWTNVLSVSDDFGSQSAEINITPYANASTRVRIAITQGYAGGGEFVYIDNVQICFFSGTPEVFLEAECGFVGSSWSTLSDALASEELYVEPKSGLNSLASAPADTMDYLTYTANITTAGSYNIFGRVQAPTTSDDSFWVRVNNGVWYRWNGLNATSGWAWRQVWDSDNSNTPISFVLPIGISRIDIAYREDGTSLDKLVVSSSSTAPTGLGNSAFNCSSSGEDTDKDGIVDEQDYDDDNDGILDVDESPASIDFSNSRESLLPGSDINDLVVGDYVLYSDALRDCDDILYDLVINVLSISPGTTVYASVEGMLVANASAAEDDHFTFTLSVVESGSATPSNPTGTPATINDFLFTPRDLDSNTGIDHTEVIAVSNTTAPDAINFSASTVLEVGGFINGMGPGASYTYFRMTPLDGPTNWNSNGNDGDDSPDYAVFLFYSSFSSIQMAFGRTGSAPSSSGGTRLMSLYASKECDRDGDGIPNRIDLDLDNDGIFDLYEAGHSELDADDDGRIDGAETGSGANGIFNGIETAAESGVLNYTYSDSDGNLIQDPFDRDSDDDGCFDTEEADVSDTDNDGVAGSGIPSVDVNGLVVSIVYDIPPTGAWQDSLASCLEICGNGMDDDGDGIPDDLDPDCAEYYLEAECGFPGENWDRGFDVMASNNDYLTISTGLESLNVPPTSSTDLVRFTVTVGAAGLYRLLGRVYSLDGSEDSFWISVDGGTWYKWNDWNTAATWQWLPVTDNDNGNTLVKFSLTPGVHTIDIAYREEGARIDKLHLTINGTTPTGDGEDAINCGRTITYNLFLPYKILNR